MVWFFNLIMRLLSFLPDSFVLSSFLNFTDELMPFYRILCFVNWFLPIGPCLAIFSGWASLLLVATIFLLIYKKL